MTVVFDGEIELRNGSWTLATEVVGEPRPWFFDQDFANQDQELLDVSVPWRPVAWTGTFRGAVPLLVEVLDAAPPSEPADGDVVEASFTPGQPTTAVVAGDGAAVAHFELTAPHYRVRYGVSGLDAGRERQVRRVGDPVADRCRVQLWAADPAPDAVLQVGSRHATGWHETVRALPHAQTEAERDEAWRREGEEQRREMDEQSRRDELDRWGGRLPGPRVMSAGWALDALAQPDRDLLDVIEVLPDGDCRVVALGVVTDLVQRTGLPALLPAVTTALADLAAGRRPDPPFRSSAQAWEATGGPPAPPEQTEPAPEAVSWSYNVVVGHSGLLPRPPQPTPVQEAARAVADLGVVSSGFEALWLTLQSVRPLVDAATLATVVRASLPTT